MGFRNFTLKTNREQQWSSLESLMKGHGATNKSICNCRSYFFDKIDCGNLTPTDKFLFYPNASIEGWQKLFDDEIKEPLTDQDYFTLNKFFCGDFSSYFFEIEDQDYYFKLAFGEVYDDERKFPLRINQEKESREIVLTENAIFFHLVNRMSRWLKAKDFRQQGLVRFNEKYFKSLLPVIDTMPFLNEKDLPSETSDGSAKPDMTQSGIKTILKFAFSAPKTESDKERVESAQKITEILMDHADDLADLRTFYNRAKADARKT